MSAPRLLPLDRTLRAPLARVWARFTTKAGLESWWGPEGFRSVVNRIDVRVGGGFEIAMTAELPEIVAYLQAAGIPITSHDCGEYHDVQEHRRLAWTNIVDFVPGVTPYTSDTIVELSATDDGGTHLVVRLSPMHDAHWTSQKTLGWEGQLQKLEQVLASPSPS